MAEDGRKEALTPLDIAALLTLLGQGLLREKENK